MEKKYYRLFTPVSDIENEVDWEMLHIYYTDKDLAIEFAKDLAPEIGRQVSVIENESLTNNPVFAWWQGKEVCLTD